ncbi:MAG: endolytic transglycosylase MltG [Minisyncoccia bacterium]
MFSSEPNDEKSSAKKSALLALRRGREAVIRRPWGLVLPAAFLLGIALALIWHGVFSAPASFVAPTLVAVSSDASLEKIAEEMEVQHVVRSASLLRLLLRISGASGRVEAGSYFFAGPQNVITVARRLARSDFELVPVRVTVIEGMSVTQIGALLDKKLAPFNEQQFVALALPDEGYLYPDTYYFLPGEDPAEIIAAMEQNFQNHVAPLQPQIAAFGRPLSNDVTMASILVGEAASDQDRRTVAGILWKRLSLGMPLQVDATFRYITTKDLTKLDGTDIATDSPYNTYKNAGLPPTPIGSPGAEAIKQAVTPIKTNYLYYLSDKNGVMHYSATYAGQEANIKKYYGS